MSFQSLDIDKQRSFLVDSAKTKFRTCTPRLCKPNNKSAGQMHRGESMHFSVENTWRDDLVRQEGGKISPQMGATLIFGGTVDTVYAITRLL